VDHAIQTLHNMPPVPRALGFRRGQPSEEGWASLEELFSDAPGAAERRAALAEAVKLQDYRSNALGVQLGQRYTSCAVVDDGTPFPELMHDPVLCYEPTTHPGGYLPHAWVEHDGRQVSTLDLAGHGRFSLVVGIGGEAWATAAEKTGQELGIELPVHFVGYRCEYDDVLGEWTARREISDRGALLVRPDRHIAWRCADRPDDPAQALPSALRHVLALDAPSSAGRTGPSGRAHLATTGPGAGGLRPGPSS
jgi:2,4-dichlorophenol 6-monooxygenase